MGKQYDVNQVEDTAEVQQQNPPPAFCYGLRGPIAIMLLIAVVLYCIGGIISGFAFKSSTIDYGKNCTNLNRDVPENISVGATGFQSTLVIVGPCFMSFSGAMLVTIILQWCFCRPILSMTKSQYAFRSSS